MSLIEILCNHENKYSVYFFADDGVVFTQGDGPLNDAITLIDKWASKVGLTVNRAKSGILQLRVDRRTRFPVGKAVQDIPVVP